MATDSSRPVTVVQPPLIDEPVAALELFPDELGVTTEAIALAGRIPGHIIGRDVVITKLSAIDRRKVNLQSFASTCLSAHENIDVLPRDVRQVGLFELTGAKDIPLGSLRWTLQACSVIILLLWACVSA